MNMNLPGRFIQSFLLILLQVMVLHQCLWLVSRQEESSSEQYHFSGGEKVFCKPLQAFMGWVLPEHGTVAGKLPSSTAPRKSQSQLHLQRQCKD